MYKSFHILNKFFQVFFDAFAGDVWPEERQITNDGQLGRGSWQKVSPISYKIANYKLQTTNCKLQIANYKLQIANDKFTNDGQLGRGS